MSDPQQKIPTFDEIMQADTQNGKVPSFADIMGDDEELKKKVGGLGSKIGGQAGTSAAPSVEGKAPFSAAAGKIGVPKPEYPKQSIEDYNKWFDDITGHKEFSLGSDLPQIKEAKAQEEYQIKRDFGENRLLPFAGKIAAGAVTKEDIQELYNEPYGKGYVKRVLSQEGVSQNEIDALDVPHLGDDVARRIANVVQGKNRDAGIVAQKQVEFQLDNELANAFKTFKYGSVSGGGGYDPTSERNSGEPTKSEFSFSEVNTGSVPELYSALKKTAKQQKIWDAEGNEVDKKEFLKKIQKRMFQLGSQKPLTQELVDMSDKIRVAVEKVPVEWKKKYGSSQELLEKDVEYIKKGLNFLQYTEPGEYQMILGTIATLGEISEDQYNELVLLGRDMDEHGKFMGGQIIEKDRTNYDFLTPQLKTSYLAGWLAEDLKRRRKGINMGHIRDKDILESYKGAPEDLKGEDIINTIRLKEATTGGGISGGGFISQTIRDVRGIFKSIGNTFDISFDPSPYESYLKSKNLIGNDKILIPQKGGGFGVDLADTPGLNKAISGFFQLFVQAYIGRGLGVLGKGVVNPLISKIDPRAMFNTSRAAISLGTPASIGLQTFGGDYIDFLEKTGSPTKAGFGAFFSSLGQGIIESVVLPDVKLAEDIVGGLRRNFAKEVINVINNGGGRVKIANAVRDFLGNVSTTLSKEALAEEVLQNKVNFWTEYIISRRTAKQRNIIKESVDIAADAMVSMSISSLFGGAAKTKINRQLSKAQLNYVGVNSGKFIESLGRQYQGGLISEADYNLAKRIISLHGENIANAPKTDVNGDLVSANRQFEYAYNSTVAAINKELAEKQKDKILQEPLLEKIKAAEDVKREIFQGKESKELPPKENEPIVINQERELNTEGAVDPSGAIQNAIESGDIKGANLDAAQKALSEGKVDGFMKEVAEQAQDETGELGVDNYGLAMDNYGVDVVDLAVKMFPKTEAPPAPSKTTVSKQDSGKKVVNVDEEEKRFRSEGAELWEVPHEGEAGGVKTGDLGVTEKGEIGTAFNMMEVQPKIIKDALNEGKYEKAIKEGRMSATYAKKIIESAGLEVPQDILIDAGLENKPTIQPQEPAKTTVSEPKSGKVAELEAQRDAEILDKGKPEVNLVFVSAKELVNSKDPVGNKKIHNDIKDRYKELKSLIDCLWGKIS